MACVFQCFGGKHKPKPPKDDPADYKELGLLKIESVDLRVKENRHAHHTQDYEVNNLVLRRGQEFEVKVTFDREFYEPTDQVKFIFKTGKQPRVTLGTEIHVPVVDQLTPKDWGCEKVTSKGTEVTYNLMTSCDALVAPWFFTVQTVYEPKKAKSDRDVVKLQEPVYILFNAWCKDDQCYMPSEAERQEYVLQQIGLIWRGSADSNSPIKWNYKQFDDVCLLGSLHLLDVSRLGETARGNVTLVARMLSQMANSSDNDGGVLSGNWDQDGDFSGGRPPSSWQGSGSIMEQYMRTNSDVRWAQCWVFAGLLTTLCRALGIPARTVTNFDSAHDTDSSMTIDFHYDSDGNPMSRLNDSVWNFHVWNEAWFQRTDLPDGNDGWQVIDATPQEESGQLYRCGPAPVKAIKEGNVFLNFDAKFIFAEVNADKISWIVESDGSMRAVQEDKNSVGKNMSTKAVGEFKRHDVTHLYKYPEGSAQERAAVQKAMKYSSRKKFINIDDSMNDCRMKLVVSTQKNADISAMVQFTNTSDQERSVTLNMTAVASYYTGKIGDELKNISERVYLQPNSDDTVHELHIRASEWINTVDADGVVKVFASAKVSETGQTMIWHRSATLDKPELDVKVMPEQVPVGREFEVRMSFTNPLDVEITKGVFTLEGPGAHRSMDVEIKGTISVGETVTERVKLTPHFPGRKEVVVGFNSRQLTGISGSASVVVT